MLAYIRESHTESMDEGGRDNRGTGGAQEPDSDAMFLTVSGRDQSIRKSTAFVTALFILASIGLVLMAKKSRIQMAGAAPAVDNQTQIEIAIGRVTGASSEMTGRMDEIVQKFYEFSDVFQVKVADLIKNPFQLVVLPAELETKKVSPGVDEEVQALRRQFDVEKATLSLLSIIQSESSTCCMINGILLEPGQRINAFVVKEIQSDKVLLAWKPDVHRAKALSRDSMTVTLALKE